MQRVLCVTGASVNQPAQTNKKWSGEGESSRAVHNTDSQGLSHSKQQKYSMDVCSGLAGLHPSASAGSGSSTVPDCARMQKAWHCACSVCILHSSSLCPAGGICTANLQIPFVLQWLKIALIFMCYSDVIGAAEMNTWGTL